MKKTAQTLGAALRKARQKRGLSVRTISDATKISMRALDAIERGDLDRLPGGVFRRAYVQAFAKEVGLDPSDLLSEYGAMLDDDLPWSRPEAPSAEADRERLIRSAAALLLGFALVILVLVVLRAASS